MSLDTVKPKGILVESYDRLSQILIDPMEFESNSLRVEKVLTGNGEAVINVRPQAAGRYDFFDDFHASTTKGVLVVK